jgi:hypothetical protein
MAFVKNHNGKYSMELLTIFKPMNVAFSAMRNLIVVRRIKIVDTEDGPVFSSNVKVHIERSIFYVTCEKCGYICPI